MLSTSLEALARGQALVQRIEAERSQKSSATLLVSVGIEFVATLLRAEILPYMEGMLL